MADYEADENVRVPAGVLFDYLAESGNLPRYFSHMTSAEPAEGDAVRVTAQLEGGREVEGEAWFRVDRENMTLAWGSEGPNRYHGHLTVTGVGDNSAVAVTVSTEHEHGAAEQIEQGVRDTVEAIKSQLEQAHPRPHYVSPFGAPPE
jgi:uncharacterized membrane protein